MRKPAEEHVTPEQLERLAADRMDAAEVARVGRHFVRCAMCRRRRPLLSSVGRATLGVEAGPGPEPVAGERYDEALDRAIAAVKAKQRMWNREKGWTERLLSVAREQPPFRFGAGEGFNLFGGLDVRAPDFAFVESLLTLSHEARYRDPASMLDLAYGAAMAARNVDREGRLHPPAVVADLQARVLGELANAYRLNDRFELAEETLLEALEHLETSGTGDAMIHTRLQDILASLRIDQRNLAEAFDLLAEVHESCLELGEGHLAGRALISKGSAIGFDDRPIEAADLLYKGLQMIDSGRDPQLAVAAEYNLLAALVEAGKFTEAGSVLLQSGLRQAFAAEPLNLLKLRWLEGKISAGLGDLRRGEQILVEVQDAFASQKRKYEAAVVGLELTGLYLRQGKAAEAEAGAVTALETFKKLSVPREARKAVRHLRDACRQQVASADLALLVVRFVRRLERNPALRFAP